MYCIQSTPSRTRCDHCADFGWVHVIVHDRVNDRRQVFVKHRVTLRLEVIPKNLSMQVAQARPLVSVLVLAARAVARRKERRKTAFMVTREKVVEGMESVGRVVPM